MLYIGICDDEKYFLSEEKEIIIKYMKKGTAPVKLILLIQEPHLLIQGQMFHMIYFFSGC